MTNRWLISKEVSEIRRSQQQLVEKWSTVQAVETIENPMIQTAAAQVLDNMRNEQSPEAENPDSMWNKMKYAIAVRMFRDLESTNEYRMLDTEWPEAANLVGLRNDNRTVVLEDGRDTVWTVNPVFKTMKTRWSLEAGQDMITVNGIDPYQELASLMAIELANEIVKEVNNDLEKLYCKNNILEYNYCIHSFCLGDTKLDEDSFCLRTPIIMKYIKTATFGD